MRKFLKHYDINEEFNDKFIYLKKTDNLDYIDIVCNNLEIIDGITYLGKTIINNENDQDSSNYIKISDTRKTDIILSFKLKKKNRNEKEEEIIVNKKIYFPKIINDFFFKIDGVNYFPVWQIVDSSTYNTYNAVVLKTLIMPIIMIKKHNQFKIVLFKKKIDIFNYYFSKFNLLETIKYFNLNIDVIKTDDNIPISNNIIVFKDGYIRYDITEKNHVYTAFIETLNNNITKKTIYDNLINKDYWLEKLGKEFSQNNNIEKADKIIVSFERILDEQTKSILRIKDEYKKDIYSIIKFMLINYEQLKLKNNMSLANKRLRLNEYLFYPLLKKFSENIYRLLNSKTITIESLKKIFNNIKPNFLIKNIVKCPLLYYYNSTNQLDLFSGLKVSFRGPQSMAEGSLSDEDNIAVEYRGLHISYIGRLDLINSSAGDPGLRTTLVPTIETHNNFFFTENEEFIYD